ncbi:MAG: Tim44/TimA family putative adaptor protein [Pseudomonadota bacterium]
MTQVFDVSTLIFLVLAVVIFLRLRSVLGRRTGHERPPFDPYAGRGRDDEAAANEDNVVSLPRARGNEPAEQLPSERQDEDVFRWTGFAEPDSYLARQFDSIAAVDRIFEPRGFIEGAKMAYEMIVTAYASGDRKGLRPLLSPDVYDGFATAIDERESRGERVDFRFVGIEVADIVDAELRDGDSHVTMKFRSSLISATFDKDGNVVEGDEKAVSDVTDIWTFARPAKSRDPNWQLIATEAAH